MCILNRLNNFLPFEPGATNEFGENAIAHNGSVSLCLAVDSARMAVGRLTTPA